MFTWTDEPYRAMWDHLLVLSHEANVKNLLCGKLRSGRNLRYCDATIIERKSRQIAKSIYQAYEYYRAADSVSLATSPLLYFYGMLSLAKSLIVANSVDRYLEDISYHGLTTKPNNAALRAYKVDPNLWTLENEYAVISGGVFQEFVKLIMDCELNRGAHITFVDIVRSDPELYELFTKIYGLPSSCAPASLPQRISDTKHSITLHHTCREDVLNGFKDIEANFEISSVNNGDVFLTNKISGDVQRELYQIYKVRSGGYFFVGAIRLVSNAGEVRIYIIPEALDYAAMFILSDCVRYKQDFWGMVLEGKSSGAIALIQRFISVSRRRFPNFILDRMFSEQFDYGIAGRMI